MTFTSLAHRHAIHTALFSHIESFCMANDFSKLMLLSSSKREKTHHFFESASFISSSKRGFVKYRSAFAGAS